MEREHLQKLDASWGHEPTSNPSGGGESMSGTLAEFPSWEGSGVGRFIEDMGAVRAPTRTAEAAALLGTM